MKAYISCPISHTQDRLDLLPEIEAIVKEKGIDTFVFEIDGTPEDIFKRDYEQLESSDILIAEVSETSHGVGIEIGISYCLGLKRILIYEKGKHISKLAQGTPDTIIIEYADLADMKSKLSSALTKLI